MEIPISGLIHNAVRLNTLQHLETFKKDYSNISIYSKDKCTLTFFYFLYQLLEMMHNKENPHVHAIKQYIMDNFYNDDFSLEKIAKAVHLAPQYCCTLFKKHTGMSAKTYYKQTRMKL